MKKLLFLLLFGLSTFAYAGGFPTRPSSHIADNANLLSDIDEQMLMSKLLAPADMYVLTLNNLNGYSIDEVAKIAKNEWSLSDHSVLTIVSVNPKKIGTYVGKDYPYVTSSDIETYNSRGIGYFKQKEFRAGFENIIDGVQNQISNHAVAQTSPQTQDNAPVSTSNVQTQHNGSVSTSNVKTNTSDSYVVLWFLLMFGSIGLIIYLTNLYLQKRTQNRERIREETERANQRKKVLNLHKEIVDYIGGRSVSHLDYDKGLELLGEYGETLPTSVDMDLFDKANKDLTRLFDTIKLREKYLKDNTLDSFKTRYYSLKAKFPSYEDYRKYCYYNFFGYQDEQHNEIANKLKNISDRLAKFQHSYSNCVTLDNYLKDVTRFLDPFMVNYNQQVKVYGDYYNGNIYSEVVNGSLYKNTIEKIRDFKLTNKSIPAYEIFLEIIKIKEAELNKVISQINALPRDLGLERGYKDIYYLNESAYRFLNTINDEIKEYNAEYKKHIDNQQRAERLEQEMRNRRSNNNVSSRSSSYRSSSDDNTLGNIASFGAGYMMGSSSSSSNDDDYRRRSSGSSDWGSSSSSSDYGSSSSSDWGSSSSSDYGSSSSSNDW